MGMAASQARYIELAARKTNVEYEGQQINQQRTALANESAGLFNSMLQLNVPTAPNYNQFVKTIYSFNDGTNDYTIDSIARTSDNPSYNAKVNYYYTTTDYTGLYKERSDLELHWEKGNDGSKILYYGTKKLEQFDPQKDEAAVRQIYTDTVVNKTDNPLMDQDISNSFVGLNYQAYLNAGETPEALKTLKDSVWRYASGGTVYYISADQTSEGKVQQYDVERQKTWSVYSGQGDGKYEVSIYTDSSQSKLLGKAYNIDTLPEGIVAGVGTDTYTSYTITTYKDGTPATTSIDAAHNKKYETTDVPSSIITVCATQPVQNCYAKDLSHKVWQKEVNAYLDKDDSGNFKSITLENYSNTFDLNVYQETDDKAYNNAMNDYVYQKAMYDKNIADINAKTEIIQQEDRTLELKLKQLDTEHNALQTEMDAVKKVCDKNVEDTFKTFS